MTTWKLSIKPNNATGCDPFNFCKENSIIGVGWAKAYESEQATNIEEAKQLVKDRYKEWPYPIKYLLEEVKEGDHVWIHQRGKYYLCKVSGDIKLGQAIHPDFIQYDLGHARGAIWTEVPDEYVTGSIQRGTIAQRTIQRIKISEDEVRLYEQLLVHLTKDPTYRPKIAKLDLVEEPSQKEILRFFSLLTPDDVEDVVSAYLQTQGWVLIKSTCFRSKPKYEFSMLNKEHNTCLVQVKSGKNPNPLHTQNYLKDVLPHQTIYLFSTNKDPYLGGNINGVKPISHKELFTWVKENIWALTASLKMRLAIS